jgi:putative two-component system response regulator
MNNDTNEKKRILLVDDDEIQLTTAELFLKSDYEIYKTGSGEEALKYLYNKEFVPSLIMLDIFMPNMNGWEVFNRIKAISYLKDIPIVFLTSMDEETEKKRAFQMGAAGFIIKPFNLTDLKGRLKEILESKGSR